ncbi:MAG: hypothetical protein QM813_09575 [Verrucomicrobiota bacterium]
MRAMQYRRLRKRSSRLWLPLLLASASASLAQQPGPWNYSWLESPADTDYWPRHFRVGVMAGLNIKADFRMSGTFAVSGYNPGAIANGTDHVYDDGYVRVDELNDTVNYWTSYWGYNNGGQSIGSTLSYHSAHTFTANGSTSETGDIQPGLDIAYGGHLGRWGDALIGWELGFGWLMMEIEDNNPIRISATRTTHTYDTGGILMPDAAYNGGSSGLGPNIKNTPSLAAEQTNVGGYVSGHTLDVSLYTLRLGPTLHWELPYNFATQVSAGAAVGLISGDLKYNETLLFDDGSKTANHGSTSDSQFVYGGYLGATLMYHVEEHGDLYLGIQYMPLSSATFSGGGREAELNMTGGLYLSFGINWPF